jgi:hypothetical protein
MRCRLTLGGLERKAQSGSPQEAFQFEQAADGIPKELCSGVEDSAGLGIDLKLHLRQTDSVDDIVERVCDFGASIQDLDRRLYYHYLLKESLHDRCKSLRMIYYRKMAGARNLDKLTIRNMFCESL